MRGILLQIMIAKRIFAYNSQLVGAKLIIHNWLEQSIFLVKEINIPIVITYLASHNCTAYSITENNCWEIINFYKTSAHLSEGI